uniref:Uncharacterized protein n=1 Tax=Arundo donax TaxID=35708 RepID=A0A0A9BA27_ARUDO
MWIQGIWITGRIYIYQLNDFKGAKIENLPSEHP